MSSSVDDSYSDDAFNYYGFDNIDALMQAMSLIVIIIFIVQCKYGCSTGRLLTMLLLIL